MITNPTVLVLGAGASMPYGFPSGYGLKEAICNQFSRTNEAVRLLHEGSSIPRGDFIELAASLRNSGQPSIDAFLEHRQEFIPAGKLAIAFCLIPSESEFAFFDVEKQRGGNWYEYLSGKLSSSFDDFRKNQLSIITFNYDRSLEHYLFTTIRSTYGRSNGESLEAMRAIPILHVYGQLSRHAYGHHEGRPYKADNRQYDAVASAAEGINLLHEAEPDLEKARGLLTAAHKICFLGFGYHPLNLQRLRVTDSSGKRSVFGTVQGKIGREVDEIDDLLHKTMLSARVEIADSDSLMFLRSHGVLA